MLLIAMNFPYQQSSSYRRLAVLIKKVITPTVFHRKIIFVKMYFKCVCCCAGCLVWACYNMYLIPLRHLRLVFIYLLLLFLFRYQFELIFILQNNKKKKRCAYQLQYRLCIVLLNVYFIKLKTTV